MIRHSTIGLVAAILSLAAAHHAVAEIRPLPRDLEIEYALSALPEHLRAGATVYSLNINKGFEVAREGSNGFHAFVARTDPGGLRGTWPFTEYRDDIYIPVAFDSAGADAWMRVFFDVEELRAGGASPEDLKRIINDRYGRGYYRAPRRAGISYMITPVFRAYLNPDVSGDVMTINVPHYMFYAPAISNEDVGGQFASPHLQVMNNGPHGVIVHPVGQMERTAINEEFGDMLERLCRFDPLLCLAD